MAQCREFTYITVSQKGYLLFILICLEADLAAVPLLAEQLDPSLILRPLHLADLIKESDVAACLVADLLLWRVVLLAGDLDLLHDLPNFLLSLTFLL